jgi:hypothetical protein
MIRIRSTTALLTAGALVLCSSATVSHISAQKAGASRHLSAPSVVQKYFRIFNSGMQNGDFSALKSVYASDGVLTQSNPLGETKVSRGLTQITAFYEAAYTKFKGGHWTQDSSRQLSPTVVLNYEFAGDASFKIPGRCAHIFMIKNGKIKTLDWVTFYSGQK